MKAKNLFVVTALVSLLSSGAFVGAQVNPPPTTLPGERTMKTLQQIEPRVAIASLPYAISQPGSYYIEKNLVGAANQNGIIIASDNVTLDLNGFELRGMPNSHSGIYISSTRYNIVIRNGAICQWGNHGVNGVSARYSTLIGLQATANVYDGLNLGEGGTVRECMVRNNLGDGIEVGSRSAVLNSLSCSNAAAGIRALLGSTIKDCTASTNRLEGIVVSDYCRVLGNICDGNNSGVHATGAGNRIEENLSSRSVTMGFKVDLVQGYNVIVKNSARNTLSRTSDYNYQVYKVNFFGPVIETLGNAVGQLRSLHPEVHPWANFGDSVSPY